MHDQQIEILSKGLADLTTDVRAIRHDQIEGFSQLREYVDQRFDTLEKRFDKSDQMQALIVKLLTGRV
jgi:hypothetical protein